MSPPTNLSGYQAVNTSGSPVAGAAFGYVVTAVSSNGQEESLPTLPFYVTGSNIDLGTSANIVQWKDSPSAPAYYNIYATGVFTWTAMGVQPSVTPTVFGYVGQSLTTTFIDQNIAPDFSRTPPQHQDPFTPGQISRVSVNSAGSSYDTGNSYFIVNLVFSGGGGSGAAGYGIVDKKTGTIVGAVVTNFGSGYTSAPTVTDDTGNATYTASLGPQAGTYPACDTYFQQRRCFGGTANFPESIVMSQPGNYANFDTSIVSNSADSITISLAGRQDNTIKSMVPMNTGLVVFTTGGANLVSGGGQGSAITPQDITALPQASFGANDLPPLTINYNILYVENHGTIVRDLVFNFYVQAYQGVDRSVLSSHLFENHTITEWCYANAPYRLVQGVRDDGILLSMTYVSDQDVFAWSRYDTQGQYKSIATVPEGDFDAVYTITYRHIPGTEGPLTPGPNIYHIERFDERVFDCLADGGAWFLDDALALGHYIPPNPLSFGGGVNVGATVNLTTPETLTPGQIITAGCGVIQVVTANTGLVLSGLFEWEIPNDPNFLALQIPTGSWTLDTPVSNISNLWHLEGKQVMALADGMVQGPFTVTNGAITLPVSAVTVIVGLSYTSRLQTLRLDMGEPTTQGQRKLIPAVTTRIEDTLGLTISCVDFSTMQPMNLLTSIPISSPYTPLVTGDSRDLVPAQWEKTGQVTYQQTAPLPCTILGVIPEVTRGDTMR